MRWELVHNLADMSFELDTNLDISADQAYNIGAIEKMC